MALIVRKITHEFSGNSLMQLARECVSRPSTVSLADNMSILFNIRSHAAMNTPSGSSWPYFQNPGLSILSDWLISS